MNELRIMQISYAFLALFVLLLVLAIVAHFLEIKQTVMIYRGRGSHIYCNLVVTLATFDRQLVAISTFLKIE